MARRTPVKEYAPSSPPQSPGRLLESLWAHPGSDSSASSDLLQPATCRLSGQIALRYRTTRATVIKIGVDAVHEQRARLKVRTLTDIKSRQKVRTLIDIKSSTSLPAALDVGLCENPI